MTLVCPDCFGDSGLKSRLTKIRPQYDDGKCDFHPTKKGIPIDAVAELVDPIFRQHFRFGDFQNWNDEQGGDPLEFCVSEFTEAEEESGEALAEALYDVEHPHDPDPFYASDHYYIREPYGLGSMVNSKLWREFSVAITYESRFFNESAVKKLEQIFDGIQYQKDADQNPPVRRLTPQGKDCEFWRARIADSSALRRTIRKHPALELGAPPMRLRRAGRMSPSGISAFYAAFDVQTAVSEIRPIVGNKVMVGRFKLTRDVYVLDMTRFSAPMKEASVFNESYEKRVNQWSFMREFMGEIAKPILGSDTHLDYIPTQAVAEYLVKRHQFKRRGKDVSIEGLIFSSAQNPGGKNIVLFGDAAKTEITKEEKAIDAERNAEVRSQSWIDPWSGDEAIQEVRPAATKIQHDDVLCNVVEGAKYRTDSHFDYEHSKDF